MHKPANLSNYTHGVKEQDFRYFILFSSPNENYTECEFSSPNENYVHKYMSD